MSRALSSSFSSVLARRAKCTRQSVINMKTRCMRRTNLQNLTTKLAIAVKQSHLMETHTHTHTHTHCERQQQLLLHPFNDLEYGLRLRFFCVDVVQNCPLRRRVRSRRRRPTKTRRLANSRRNSSQTANNRTLPVATTLRGDCHRSPNSLPPIWIRLVIPKRLFFSFPKNV